MLRFMSRPQRLETTFFVWADTFAALHKRQTPSFVKDFNTLTLHTTQEMRVGRFTRRATQNILLKSNNAGSLKGSGSDQSRQLERHVEPEAIMFEKFDERTVANMQVALNRACEKLPPGRTITTGVGG